MYFMLDDQQKTPRQIHSLLSRLGPGKEISRSEFYYPSKNERSKVSKCFDRFEREGYLVFVRGGFSNTYKITKKIKTDLPEFRG